MTLECRQVIKACVKLQAWLVAILNIDKKLGDLSNALEKLSLSLETCKSTDKWY